MSKLKAKYQIDNTFKVTGRGVVFAGIIIEGAIRPNDLIEFEFRGEILKRKITGVESIRPISEKTSTSILIECKDEVEIDELRNWTPNHTVAKIYDSEQSEIS